MKNFSIEEDGMSFKFLSMNRRRIQLFQVYVMHEGQQHRFHMQIDEETGDFHFTNKSACPEKYHYAEQQFSHAIKIYGVSDVIPT